MKVVILAGGRGTRISEESGTKPKPMIEIGQKPIIWHIMKIYSQYGFNEFVVCCGYKGSMIKEFFVDYYMNESDITVDLTTNSVKIHKSKVEPWSVTLVNTGIDTQTAGRLLMVKKYLDGENTFMLTYGDGVSDVNIRNLLKFHNSNGKIATITAAKPTGRFGTIEIGESDRVDSFREKLKKDESWVNIGFCVFDKKIFEYLGNGDDMLEFAPYELLAKEGQMMAYKHRGFWSPMDTLRDKVILDNLWNNNEAPWKIWD